MFNNGVSHATASWDDEGVRIILRWLSYLPSSKNSPLPILLNPRDTIDRDIGYTPPHGGYDPRHLLNGTNKPGE